MESVDVGEAFWFLFRLEWDQLVVGEVEKKTGKQGQRKKKAARWPIQGKRVKGMEMPSILTECYSEFYMGH